MANDTKTKCPDCAGTGKTTVRTSHGRAWRRNCSMCRGRGVRKPLYNVRNAANGNCCLIPTGKGSVEEAEAALELYVSRGFDRDSLYVVQL